MGKKNEIVDWIKLIKKQTGKPQVDYQVHKPTAGELNNLCYLSMKYIAGWPMRHADLAIISGMGGEPETVSGMDGYVEALADYIWDHLMGEPAKPTVSQVKRACVALRDMLYAMDEKTRNSTEVVNG